MQSQWQCLLFLPWILWPVHKLTLANCPTCSGVPPPGLQLTMGPAPGALQTKQQVRGGWGPQQLSFRFHSLPGCHFAMIFAKKNVVMGLCNSNASVGLARSQA